MGAYSSMFSRLKPILTSTGISHLLLCSSSAVVVVVDAAYGKQLSYSYLCSMRLIVVVAVLRFADVSYNKESEYNNSPLSLPL